MAPATAVVHFDASTLHCYVRIGEYNRALLVMIHPDP
jgi:hypothetical protein